MLRIRILLMITATLALAGCMTATEREAADDSACAAARDYNICRQNIMSHRRDLAIMAQ
jgi:hypothetical protein